MDVTPGSLGTSVSSITVMTTAHVKLVSAVLRGERVRVEDWEGEGAVVEMMVRPPDTIVLSLSRQVKAYCIVPRFTTALSTMAMQVRVVSPTPPATRGESGARERVTTGVETA